MTHRSVQPFFLQPREQFVELYIVMYTRRANVKRWGNLTEHPVPYNMTLTKGRKLMAVTRGYVDFVLHHPKAQVFKQWVANTRFPDETFFSSLNHNPHLGVPGSHTSEGSFIF